MEQNRVPDSQLDSDIAVVRSQIESLRHRRSLLANTLLSNRKIQQRLKHAKTSAPAGLRLAVTKALDQTESQASINASNLYRTCSGITAFRVKDPDPNAIDSGNVLGVRIDVFSTTERRFITPYYLLLNHPDSGSSALKIHKHTVPSFIPLPALVKKYLPQLNTGDSPPQHQSQNLPALVRALRRELVAHHKRLAAWEILQNTSKTNKLLNPSGTEFEIELSGNSVARLTVDSHGKIENAVVRARDGMEYDRLPSFAGNRQRDIERAILGGGGRIEGLMERIRTHVSP